MPAQAFSADALQRAADERVVKAKMLAQHYLLELNGRGNSDMVAEVDDLIELIVVAAELRVQARQVRERELRERLLREDGDS